MRTISKRVLSGLVAFTAAVSLAPSLTPNVAIAAGSLEGELEVRSAGGAAPLTSGHSGTTFTLELPTDAACAGDSANDGYRVYSYIVPASVDPGTLTFDGAGPVPFQFGADLRSPLFTTLGDPYVNAQTANASTPGGPGPIINIPDFNYGAVFGPGDIPAGAYNLGIACTLGPAGPDQMKEYWNVTKTFTVNPSGGPSEVDWTVGAVPAAPTLTSVTPGDGTLTAAFTAIPSSPATTSFTVTATPTGGGTPVTETDATSPITVSGLDNGVPYDVTVRATNDAGDSDESNLIEATPNLPAVQNLAWFPAGPGTATLTWDAPTGTAPDGYRVEVSPADVGPFTLPGDATEYSVSGLTPGEPYTITVIPTHGGDDALPASVSPVVVLGDAFLVQPITVTRPVGALVLTQVCGAHGPIAADETGTPGFPVGSLPAVSASGSGTAPTLTLGGSDQDPHFDEYPYPENADGTPAPNYPTHCGIDLGVAKLVKNGPGSGQFFATSGLLNQVTVVDTRDTDTGWTVNGLMSDFVAGVGKEFSGSQLGWTPQVTSDSEAFTDSDGNEYDQVVTEGAVVAPNTANASGLSSGRTLGSAEEEEGLGIGVLDARLKLLIPVTAPSGTYTGTLTISVI